MSLLEILIYPHEILVTPGSDVTVVDDGVRDFLDDLAETMYAFDGVGLAANQVGNLRRICVIDVRHNGEGEEPGKLIELINPRIVERSGQIHWEEGCLSFPELFENVARSKWVRVEALDRHGEKLTIEGEDMLAVVLQYEIDHLDGIIFPERMSRLKRRMALKRFKRMLEAKKEDQGETSVGGT